MTVVTGYRGNRLVRVHPHREPHVRIRGSIICTDRYNCTCACASTGSFAQRGSRKQRLATGWYKVWGQIQQPPPSHTISLDYSYLHFYCPGGFSPFLFRLVLPQVIKASKDSSYSTTHIDIRNSRSRCSHDSNADPAGCGFDHSSPQRLDEVYMAPQRPQHMEHVPKDHRLLRRPSRCAGPTRSQAPKVR